MTSNPPTIKTREEEIMEELSSFPLYSLPNLMIEVYGLDKQGHRYKGQSFDLESYKKHIRKADLKALTSWVEKEREKWISLAEEPQQRNSIRGIFDHFLAHLTSLEGEI